MMVLKIIFGAFLILAIPPAFSAVVLESLVAVKWSLKLAAPNFMIGWRAISKKITKIYILFSKTKTIRDPDIERIQ